MFPVHVEPEVVAALEDQTPRQLRNGVSHAVTALLADDLDGRVRPWDLAGLRDGARTLGEVTSARAVHVAADVLVVELVPAGRRIALRRIDDGWRLARFVEAGEHTLPPEATRRITLSGWGPDSVLAALGIDRPSGVELEYLSEDLGQGETESRCRYQWVADGRSVLAEEVRNEIYDGATPYTTYLRGVVVDGDRGMLLTGSGDRAVVVEG
ncbi:MULTISPECIES: hypothetical protein [unclassified Mycobacterium]|uniref:hypothetical protein n=1 Tax=unclassified Mycobacterium TaxID=2642494 RepID=UPI0029C7D105|nr:MULTISPECIES: hypothetical protein [unclassified Mycobacterium]